MIILAYNIPQPTTGDRGSVFFPALEQVIQRLSSHDHDGNNTALISAGGIQSAVVSVPAASWTASGTGRYVQTVVLPTGFTYDNSTFEVRLVTGGSYQVVYTNINKLSSNQCHIFSNDNTVDFELHIK